MQALRPVLRRRLPVLRQRPAIRYQQNYGPHKEYFQTPGQAPVSDTTPYDPKVPIQTQIAHHGPTRKARFARSLLWASLFSVLGAAGGAALITWEYLQPPFEPGSEEEQELQSEIDELLATHPILDEMRSDGWVEDNFYDQKRQSWDSGSNMVHHTLTGTQGLTIKAFRHQTTFLTMLIFFPGFGVEGWPDVMHGGVTTSMFLEAIAQQFKNFYAADYQDLDQSHVTVDFRNRARPGEIYAIMVPPPTAARTVTDPPVQKLIFYAPMFHIDAAPKIEIETDAKTQHQKMAVTFPKSQRNMVIALGTVELSVGPRETQVESAASISQDKDP